MLRRQARRHMWVSPMVLASNVFEFQTLNPGKPLSPNVLSGGAPGGAGPEEKAKALEHVLRSEEPQFKLSGPPNTAALAAVATGATVPFEVEAVSRMDSATAFLLRVASRMPWHWLVSYPAFLLFTACWCRFMTFQFRFPAFAFHKPRQ